MGAAGRQGHPVAQDEIYTPFFVNAASKYIVRRGDSLSKLANRYGMSWHFAKQNPSINNPNRIYPRQVLGLSVTPSDYGNSSNWLNPPEALNMPVEIFFVYPTMYTVIFPFVNTFGI